MAEGRFFDSGFFAEAFERLSESFAERHDGEAPIVVLTLDDGTDVHVVRLAEAAEGWVSVLAYSGRARGPYRKDASPDELPRECVQLTVPLGRIRRIVHSREPETRIGFGD